MTSNTPGPSLSSISRIIGYLLGDDGDRSVRVRDRTAYLPERIPPALAA